MKRFAFALLMSTLLSGAAVAQDGPSQVEQTLPPAASSVDALARKIEIITRTKTVTAIPENEPLPIDLGQIEAPTIPARLTRDVTAKGYARHVVVDGDLIGQLVMTGVAKAGRVEPLNSNDFVAQFTLDRPELDPTAAVTVEGNEEELIAALERLAATDDEEEEEKAKEESADDGSDGAAGKTGSGSGTQNADAANYETPKALDLPDAAPATTVRVTTEGCDIRVDLDQLQAIQQNRVETIEDGNITPGSCEDGDQRFPIKRSYAACGDLIDREGRTAKAQYLLYYTDAGGTRAEVGDCQPDEDQVFNIVEKSEACTIKIDYAKDEAVPQAALIYVNANNNEVQVRGCQASEEVAAVPLTPVTDGCTIRHDFTAGRSYQQGRHVYELDGITWFAGTCADNGAEYVHERVYETDTGTSICPALINEDNGTATLQSKVAIVVNGVRQYISECEPDTSTLALAATTDGCDNPATWSHDINAGVSYGEQRFFYLRSGVRQYVTECRTGAATYPHHVETVGWQNHDDQLFAYRVETIYIDAPTGRYDVKTAVVQQGAIQVPYVYEGERQVANGTKWYEDCTRYQGRDRVQTYRRPDDSTLDRVTGTGDPLSEGNVCTADSPTHASEWTTASVYQAESYVGSASITNHCTPMPTGQTCTNNCSATFTSECKYTATRRVVREDGTLVNTTTASKTVPQLSATYSSTAVVSFPSCPTINGSPNSYGSASGRFDSQWNATLAGRFTQGKPCPANPTAAQVTNFISELGW